MKINSRLHIINRAVDLIRCCRQYGAPWKDRPSLISTTVDIDRYQPRSLFFGCLVKWTIEVVKVNETALDKSQECIAYEQATDEP